MTDHQARVIARVTTAGLVGIVALVTLLDALYQIDPGSAGVVVQFREYVRATGPGLHFKMPFVEAVEQVPLNGHGVPQDAVEAYMLFDRAAAQSSDEDRERYTKARDGVAALMTVEQIADAQRRAREWTPTPEP